MCRSLSRTFLLFMLVTACALLVATASPRTPASRTTPDDPTVLILNEQEDHDHDIYCDCAWEAWPGQSCQETRNMPGFPCWSDCCAQIHGPRELPGI